MKRLSILLIISLCAHVGFTQEADYLKKVQTLDSTIETLYAVISGDAGEKRDWELFKFLFTPDAQLIPSRPNDEGKVVYRKMTPAGYSETSGESLETNGFFEKEIYRVTETFGSVTHVFSTYESYETSTDKEPFTRGINSIQLMNDGERWWILNIYWTGEREDNPIPKKYLPR